MNPITYLLVLFFPWSYSFWSNPTLCSILLWVALWFCCTKSCWEFLLPLPCVRSPVCRNPCHTDFGGARVLSSLRKGTWPINVLRISMSEKKCFYSTHSLNWQFGVKPKLRMILPQNFEGNVLLSLSSQCCCWETQLIHSPTQLPPERLFASLCPFQACPFRTQLRRHHQQEVHLHGIRSPVSWGNTCCLFALCLSYLDSALWMLRTPQQTTTLTCVSVSLLCLFLCVWHRRNALELWIETLGQVLALLCSNYLLM